MTLLSSSPQHCLKGEGGEIKIILDCFQIVYYDLTISLNIFCEGLKKLELVIQFSRCENDRYTNSYHI